MNLIKEPITDKKTISKLIPQRNPIVMVDKLLFYSEDKVISGLTICEDNLFVNNSQFTASGLVENMAQTVALHTGYQYFLKNEPAPTGYIGAIKKVEINEFPKVGSELITTVLILHEIMGVTLVSAQVECNGVIVALSEMKTVIA